MSSTKKTPFLKLNSWVGGDKPNRSDFVRDNDILDSVLSKHIESDVYHLSIADREKLNFPYHYQTYFGDGSDYQTIEINSRFEPSWGFVFSTEYPNSRYDYDNSTHYHYFGFFTKNNDLCGFELKGKYLKVKNEFSTIFQTEAYAFNQRGIAFNIIAFR